MTARKAWALFALSAAVVLYGSLYPWQLRGPDPHWAAQFWNPASRLFEVTLNLAIYVPIGFFLYAAKRNAVVAILASAGLSLSAEFAQIFIVSRDPRARDVVVNTMGAAIGVLLARTAAFLARVDVWVPKPPAALVALWAGFQLYPFHPVGRFIALVENSFSRPSATSGFSAAADWLAAFAAVLAWARGRPRMPVVCVAALLPARILLTGRKPDATETGGWIAATALSIAFSRQVAYHPHFVAIALGVGVLFRELAPYHLSSTGTPFQWIPFQSILAAQWFFAIFLVMQKAFIYAALVWLAGGRRITATVTAVIASAVLLIEALQQYLPGRTPDITDAVLVVVMAAALRICEHEPETPYP